jgi:hypothetical protein
MAKPILLNWGDKSVSFAPTRVDRTQKNVDVIDRAE